MTSYKVTFYKGDIKISEQIHNDVTASYAELRTHLIGFMKTFIRNANRVAIEQI
jgi:hypothetical protein